jgi:hypothetical protein
LKGCGISERLESQETALPGSEPRISPHLSQTALPER